MMRSNKDIVALISIMFCSFLNAEASDMDLEKIMSLDNFDHVEQIKPQYDELKYWALRYGMYFGYEAEMSQIRNDIEGKAELLNKVYNFRNLIIEDNLLPPVIIKGYNFYERNGDLTTESSEIYRIRRQASYAYNSPTWRDYLYFGPGEFSKPVLNPGIKPKDDEAKAIWEASVQKGYEKGVSHAREVFQYKMSELTEDFQGMILAHHLYKLNMLDVSRIVKMEKGTVVSEEGININEVVTRMENNDRFKPIESWQPMIRVHNPGAGK